MKTVNFVFRWLWPVERMIHFGWSWIYFFLFCGVCGRLGLDCSPAYWYFAFFSLGFKIWNWQSERRKALRLSERIMDGLSTHLKRTHEWIIDWHHSAGVVEFSAVIWSGEQRDQRAFGKELVAVFDDLVGPANQIQVMAVEELRDNVGTEGETHAAVILAPALHVLVWVRPKEITQKSSVWHVCRSHYSANLLHALKWLTTVSCNRHTLWSILHADPGSSHHGSRKFSRRWLQLWAGSWNSPWRSSTTWHCSDACTHRKILPKRRSAQTENSLENENRTPISELENR